MKRVVLSIVGSLTFFTQAIAGGYQLALQSNKHVAMGNVSVALPQDASSIFYNPGSLATLESGITLGAFGVVPRLRYADPNSDYRSGIDKSVETPFYAYGHYKVKERLSLGLGVYVPFGSAASYPSDWKGAHLVKSINLQPIYIQPNFSVKATKWLSVGFAPVVVMGSVRFVRAVPLTGQNTGPGEVDISASGRSLSFNTGALVTLGDFKLGVSYLHKVQVATNRATVTFDVPPLLKDLFPDGLVSASLPLPGILNTGVSYSKEKFGVSAQVSYAFWGVFDSLAFQFQKQTDAVTNTSEPRMYENSPTYNLGAYYKPTDRLTLRMGVLYDVTPVQSDYVTPEIPDNDKIAASAGITLALGKAKNWDLDLSFIYLRLRERTTTNAFSNFAATYSANVYAPGIGFGYKFITKKKDENENNEL